MQNSKHSKNAEKFRFFEHTADVEFEAYGKSLEEVFENAALAIASTMVNVSKVEKKIEREISIESEDLLSLLYDFLEKLIFYHDAENFVFAEVKVSEIREKEGKYYLRAVAYGEKFNKNKHMAYTSIKAVTYHNMEISEKEGRFFAHVIIDI